MNQNQQNQRNKLKGIIKTIIREQLHNEDWKSAVAAGLLGLSTLTTQGAPQSKTDIPPSVRNISTQSIVDVIKGYENSKNNPKGGYNKSLNKWFPHKSIEGGAETIAYGHKILPNENFKNGLTDAQAIDLLKKDIAAKESLAKSKIPKYDNFPSYVKNAILNALYRGDIGPKTIKLINSGQWSDVSSEYLNHTNYKSGNHSQIKQRMKTNADAFDAYANELKK